MINFEKRIKDVQESGNETLLYSLFEEIYNEYYKLVIFVISTYIRNKEDIKDITQDTFISFFKTLKKGGEIANIKYYLVSIARNNSLRNLEEKNMNISEFNDSIYSFEEENSEMMIDSKLNSLAFSEREIIINHIYLNKTFKEIALERSVSLNTIKSTYRRAILKLKKII